MTASIVYADTREPMPLTTGGRVPYLSDADRRVRKGWPKPAGQLWSRATPEGNKE